MGFDILSAIVIGCVLFIKNAVGVLQTPYETCRKLASGERLEQLLPLGFLTVAYFGWSVLVRQGVRAHPMLLTYSMGTLLFASFGTFFLVVATLVMVGRLFRGRGSFRTVILLWGYSMLPTVMWFWITSVLWIVYPPPRTDSFTGQMLSAVFLIVSLFLFFWKGVLYYLTLRFGMRLDLLKILGVTAVVFPLGGLYALIMYTLGIFRVPFI